MRRTSTRSGAGATWYGTHAALHKGKCNDEHTYECECNDEYQYECTSVIMSIRMSVILSTRMSVNVV